MLMATKKVRPSVWMCGWMMAWAVVSACSALAKSYTHMVVLRFILGVSDSLRLPSAR
jgi:predicted MFS family arabinose efflux permease